MTKYGDLQNYFSKPRLNESFGTSNIIIKNDFCALSLRIMPGYASYSLTVTNLLNSYKVLIN